MAANGFELALDECLDLVLKDEQSVEGCLRRYPEHAEEMAPLLQMAHEVRSTLDYTPSTAGKTRARLLMQAAIARQQARKERRWQWPGWLRVTGPPRWAVGMATMVLVMVLGGTGVVAASSDSMPDQPLYPVKRAVEEARLVLSFSSNGKAQLHARFADRRVVEIAVLSKRGNIKRVPGLTGDLDRHLRRIQHAAFPDAVPAIPLRLLEGMTGQELQTPVPIVPGIAPPPPSNEPQRLRQGQARPQPLSPRVQFVMQALRNRLTLGFAQQEQALRLSISEARDIDKRTLRYTLRVLQEHRNTIMVAFTEEQAPR